MEEVEEMLFKSKILLLEDHHVHKAGVCSHDNCKQRENIANRREDMFKYLFRTCFGKIYAKAKNWEVLLRAGLGKFCGGRQLGT